MKEKLMLAMSGGVDSSAALALLQEDYDVIGATLRLYGSSPQDVSDAKAVADRFGIEHHVFDMQELFRKHVLDDFVATYLSGGTPNPCIQCNKHIKFGALLDEAIKLGCRYYATGHYARVEYDKTLNRYLLKKALLQNGEISPKDQSYVLYNLTQEQLSHIVLPLGYMEKSAVRSIAQDAGLINHSKPDSQDICFVPDGDYSSFIERYTGTPPEQGNFISTNGEVLGTHKGIIHYTVGQRKGLGIALGKPMFVIGKDAESNAVILGESEQLMRRSLTARDVNLISVDSLTAPLECKAKTRYTQAEQPCLITMLENGRAHVEFAQPQRATSAGQSVVFYDGDTVIGGGIIEEQK